MRDQRRGGRLAVGAGDGDERRVGRDPPPLAAEQLDVADDLDAGACARARPSSAARDGSAARRARAPARRTVDQSIVAQIGGRDAGRRGLGDACARCRPRRRRRRRRPASALRSSQAPSRRGRTPRRVLPAKLVTGIMRSPHRSFSVDRPTSASTTAMIQKRITICGSVQPICSK